MQEMIMNYLSTLNFLISFFSVEMRYKTLTIILQPRVLFRRNHRYLIIIVWLCLWKKLAC